MGDDVCVQATQIVLLGVREGPGEINLRYEDPSMGEGHLVSAAFRLRMAPWSPLWVLSLTFGQDNLSNGRCDCGFPEDGGRVSKSRAGVTIYLERVPLVRGEPGQVRVTDDEEYLSR